MQSQVPKIFRRIGKAVQFRHGPATVTGLADFGRDFLRVSEPTGSQETCLRSNV